MASYLNCVLVATPPLFGFTGSFMMVLSCIYVNIIILYRHASSLQPPLPPLSLTIPKQQYKKTTKKKQQKQVTKSFLKENKRM